MNEPFFRNVDRVAYEGPDTTNLLAYRYYDRDALVAGKRMEDHLRFAVCYWHTFCWGGADTFGADTFGRPWHGDGDTMKLAQQKTDTAFELFSKLGAPYFTFHDRDVAPEGDTLAQTNLNLDRVAEQIETAMARIGIGLLWGTANLFSHPRYAAGAATNPDPEVFAFAAAQVKKAIDVTHRLNGANYVLWGGREGYDTLLNTDMRRELEQLGRFMQLVVEYKHQIGFRGTILIEPKPMEPTKHQYDYDAAAVHAFLRRFGLEKEIKLNIEVNHATLAGHSFEHELAYAAANGILGSVDINRGDPQLGWDTDQFPNSAGDLILPMYIILQHGGLNSGGFNFDAKLRRQSIDPEDLLHAHVGGIDTLALALRRAAKLLEDGKLADHVKERYAGWDEPLGRAIGEGKRTLAQLADEVHEKRLAPLPRSGKQEMLENLMNRYKG